MNRIEYERLCEAVEREHRANLEALERVYRLAEKYPAEEKEEAPQTQLKAGDREFRAAVVGAVQENVEGRVRGSEPATSDHVGRWVEIPVDPGTPSELRSEPDPSTEEKTPSDEATVEAPPDVQRKRCSRCGEVKPTDQFYKDLKSPDGYNVWCRACHSEARKERIEKKRAEKAAAKSEASPPEDKKATQSVRLCANGSRCVRADPTDPVPYPAVLDAANKGPLCRGCQRRAGTAA